MLGNKFALLPMSLFKHTPNICLLIQVNAVVPPPAPVGNSTRHYQPSVDDAWTVQPVLATKLTPSMPTSDSHALGAPGDELLNEICLLEAQRSYEAIYQFSRSPAKQLRALRNYAA
jgi:hypothetical protein